MNKIHLKISFVLLMILTGTFSTKGQQDKTYPAIEKVSLFTDRSIYITGEDVHFSAFLSPHDKKQPELSLILYAEIVSPEGKSLAGSKFPIVNYAASGDLTIPKDIITGVYYMRAYTKYMRNMGPNAYCYVAVKIVNPLRSDVMTGNDTTKVAKNEAIAGNTANAFVISLDKNKYAPRDVVNVAIKATGIKASDVQGLSISVVPEASSSENILQVPAYDHQVTSLRFLPETRGVSITGILKDNTSGKAVPDTRVNLSIIGKGRDFMAMQTDSAGRYFFSLPAYTGFRDLFLCAENTAGFHPKIIVDNDFCLEPVHLPSPIFKLTADERAATYNMAVNARLRKLFAADTIPCAVADKRADKASYGEPSEILVIDKYVQLPTLEDYFFELPTFVKVRKRHGEKYLKVIGTQAEMTIFDPLMLVDWIAVADPAKILAISPSNIDRIELVYEPYVKGDITYGGIVNIISKRGDFAGIDLPASGIFLNYLFLDNSRICTASDSNSANIPDARNTLYWDPNLVLNTDNSTHFKFTTPDTPGRYAIVLKGISRDGNPFTRTEVFEVK